MDNNEIMTVEENEIEVYEDAATENSGSRFGVGVGVGAAAMLVSGLVYKFVIEPLNAKRKAKKRMQAVIDAEGSLTQDDVNVEIEDAK